MNLETVKGLVIQERKTGENDKVISVMTEDFGTIDIVAKGANKLTAKNHSAAQLLVYAVFCYDARKSGNYLNSSEVIDDFYDLRLDIRKFALACYICEVTKFAIMTNRRQQENNNILRLILNCFYLLQKDKRSCEFIKSVFELRFSTDIGFMPQLIGCLTCFTYSAPKMYFLVDLACVYCSEHFIHNMHLDDYYNVPINPDELAALQFICLSDFENIFNFRLSVRSQEVISEISEKYILTRLGRSFVSLDYYYSVS